MWFFILLILFGAWLQTIIKLAVATRVFRWACLLLFTAPMIFMYPQAVRINLKDFNFLMNNINVLNSICVLVIVQEAMALILGSALLRRYYLEKKIQFWYYSSLLPSSLFPALCFVGMVYLFNTCSGTSFQGIALWLGLGVFAVSGILAELLSLFIKDREQLTLWAVLLSLTQIFTAMFLPVVLSGKSSGGNYINFDLSMIAGMILLLVLTAIFTLLAHFKVWRKLFFIKRWLGACN